MDVEEFRRKQQLEVAKIQAITERVGLRILFTYQCIFCGRIIDDHTDAMLHIENCGERK